MYFDHNRPDSLRPYYVMSDYLPRAPQRSMTRREEGEEAMITVNGFVGGAIVLCASVAAMGCASQSDAFRQMSAVDHESAARSDPAQAQQHLEAATQLRQEEQSACYGIPDSDRVQGPFARPDRIAAIEVVRDRGEFPKAPLKPVGVAVDVRAEPGMTQQWLGRLVACHMAHVAVAGQDPRPSLLSVANARVAVSSTSVGFRVTVTSSDSDVARALVGKGQELADSTFGRPGASGVGVASIR
jgi:hypothetical protein